MKNTIIKEFRVNKGSKTEPTRTRPYIEFTCFHCNTVQTESKATYKEDKPCRECVKRLRGKTNFFIKAVEKFGDKFDLSKAEQTYFDYTTPIPVICNIHNHEYMIKPVHFIANSYNDAPHKGGCPICQQEVNRSKNQKTSDYYLQLIEEKFIDVSIETFPTGITSSDAEFTARCVHHGVFTKKMRDILTTDSSVSNMCPHCSREKLAWSTRQARTDIPGLVYFVYFSDVNLYKCGVTYRTTQERLKSFGPNMEVKWEIPFNTISEAYAFEQQFFRKYYSYRCSHPNTSIGGYTEFLSIDIPKPPNECFMAVMSCRKKSNSEELPPSNVEDNSERSLATGTFND